MATTFPRRFAFTEKRLRQLPAPATGRVYYRDSNTPGLAICKTASGSSTFYVYKKVAGRPVRVRLGGLGELTVSNARDMAGEVNSKLARGEDPREEKRKARSAITLGELWDYYLKNHAQVHKRAWQGDEVQWKRYMTQTWTSRRIDTIHTDDIRALHRRIGTKHGPYAANRLRSLLSAMFNLAIQDLGFKGPNPVAGVRKFKETSRERFLKPDELPRFFDALKKLRVESPVAADFLEVCLWCGARRGNVLAMRWEELDLDAATWLIPAEKAKAGDLLRVHLPDRAVEILRRRQAEAKGEWVFPGRRKGKHLTDPMKPWHKVLKTAGLTDLRIHDLRRSLGSYMAATNASLPIIGKALGHRHAGTTAIYARLDVDPVRTAVNAAAAAIQTAAQVEKEKPASDKQADAP